LQLCFSKIVKVKYLVKCCDHVMGPRGLAAVAGGVFCDFCPIPLITLIYGVLSMCCFVLFINFIVMNN